MSRKPLNAGLGSGRLVKLDVETPDGPEFSTDAPVIDTGHDIEPAHRRVARLAAGLIGLIVTLIVAMFFILSATVVFIAPGGVKHAVVLRNAYSLGSVPAGVYVLASNEPAHYSLFARIGQAVHGVSGGAVVRILAGPNGLITTKAGDIFLDGKDTGYAGQARRQRLNNTYIAECVTGACTPGDTVLIDEQNIIGGVKGYASLSGIHPVTAP